MQSIRRWLAAVVHEENLDLYLLLAVAVVFTVLGSIGVASTAAISSTTLGALAILAFSQIRSRAHVARIADRRQLEPAQVLSRAFPDDFDNRRAAARDYLYVGVSMYRTLPTLRDDLRRMAQAGHRVRVVLLDPQDEWLMRGAALHLADVSADDLAGRVTSTLRELSSLNRDITRPIELRVAPVIPTMNMNLIDQREPDGVVVLQHYEYLPTGANSPVIRLDASAGYWYRHFVSEAERIWESSLPWPLSPAARAAQHLRPRFTQLAPQDLFDNLETASDLLITGVTRNNLLTQGKSKVGVIMGERRRGAEGSWSGRRRGVPRSV